MIAKRDMALLKLIFTLVIISFIALNATAQVPEYRWFKVYGSRYVDEGESVINTPDGGYLIAGYSYYMVSGGTDVYLVKTDDWGIMEWERGYGSYGDDWASCVRLADDGGYIITGGTDSYSEGDSDVLLMKVDAEGELVWSRTYGGRDDESANYIQLTSDGGYIIVGWTRSYGAGGDDIYLIKIDAAGEIEWSQTYGNEFQDKGYEVLETSDGGFVLVGGVDYFAYTPANAYVVKTSSSGETLWSTIIGGSDADAGNAITKTLDNGFVIVGWTMTNSIGMQDIYLIKLDSLGTIKWEKSYGGEDSDISRSILTSPDGGFLVAGYTESFGNGEQDVYLIRTDYKGDSLWTTTFGGTEYDYANDIILTADDGVAFTGFTSSYGQGSKDVLLVKYEDIQLCLDNDNHTLPGDYILSGNYPNPFNAATTIEFNLAEPGLVSLVIYDLLGREVKVVVDGCLDAGSYSYNINLVGLTSGTYFYKLCTNGSQQSRKMMLLK